MKYQYDSSDRTFLALLYLNFAFSAVSIVFRVAEIVMKRAVLQGAGLSDSITPSPAANDASEGAASKESSKAPCEMEMGKVYTDNPMHDKSYMGKAANSSLDATDGASLLLSTIESIDRLREEQSRNFEAMKEKYEVIQEENKVILEEMQMIRSKRSPDGSGGVERGIIRSDGIPRASAL